MDVFPTKRASVGSLIPSDFSVTHCNITNTNESLTVPAYGMCAIITNKSYGFVEVQIIENRTGNAGSATSGAGEHLSLIFTRTSTIDLSTTGLAVLGFDNYVSILDDVVNNDAASSLLIIPDAVADLQTIYEKYTS